MVRWLIVTLFSLQLTVAQNVLTGSYDTWRTNADISETLLNPNTVSASQFARLFSLPVDGQIYTQPLYYQGNVYVTTLHNSVYAYNGSKAGPPLWTVNLGPSVPTDLYGTDDGSRYTDLSPEVGILGTPVIDPSTGTLYVVAATLENGTYYHRLHALDTTTGAEKFGAPVVIQATSTGTGDSSTNGVVSFVSGQHLQRPALLLLNGVIYVAFGSHADNTPYHGWVMGYSAANVQNQTAVFNASPNGGGGAIWQSGRGLVADTQGNIYVVTSNGDTDEATNFSDNVLSLSTPGLTVNGWFAPSNVQVLNDSDEDLGSSGPILIPGTNFLLAGGKQGYLYLLNKGTLSKATQSVHVENSAGIYNMALWNRSGGPVIYMHPENSPFSSYSMTNGKIQTTPASQGTSAYGVPFQGMTISANGGQPGSGILWATTADSYPLPSTGTLHAYDADSLSTELWNSNMNTGDALGAFMKFVNPTVANGKVYVAGASSLMVYGLTGGHTTGSPVITGIVNAASYANAGLAPGEIVAVYGLNLGPQLEGTQVTFNNVSAPLLYASGTMILAVVPFEVAGATQITVQATCNGQISPPTVVAAAASAPGIFSLNASGSGPGAILNQDFGVNSTTNPAAAGSVVMIYATGGGLTNPQGMTGAMAKTIEPLASKVSVTVGGVNAPVSYAGSAPTEIEGLIQINAQLPASLANRGVVPVVVTVAGQVSQSTVTLNVK